MQHTSHRTALLILLLVSLLWMNTRGQDSTSLRIEKIRMECERINKSIPKFKVVEEPVTGQSTEGGELKKFFDGTTIRKATLTLYGETGQLLSEYYFENSDLIFVSETAIHYKAAIYMGKTEVEREEEDKFYFSNQKLALWVDHSGIPKDPVLYPEKEKEFLSDLKNIINKVK